MSTFTKHPTSQWRMKNRDTKRLLSGYIDADLKHRADENAALLKVNLIHYTEAALFLAEGKLGHLQDILSARTGQRARRARNTGKAAPSQAKNPGGMEDATHDTAGSL